MATETSQPPISAGFQRMVGAGRLLSLPGPWGPGIWEFLWGVRTEGPSLQNPHLVFISYSFPGPHHHFSFLLSLGSQPPSWESPSILRTHHSLLS